MAWSAQYSKAALERRRAYQRGYARRRRRTHRDLIRQREAERFKRHRAKRLANSRRGYLKNRDARMRRQREINRRNYLKDPKKSHARTSGWIKKNRAIQNKIVKRWRAKHRDVINAKDRAKRSADPVGHRARAKATAAKKPDHYRAINLAGNARRKARLAAAPIGDQAAVRAFYKSVRTEPIVYCHWCRAEVAPRDRTVDHVIAIVNGGAHAVEKPRAGVPLVQLQQAGPPRAAT